MSEQIWLYQQENMCHNAGMYIIELAGCLTSNVELSFRFLVKFNLACVAFLICFTSPTYVHIYMLAYLKLKPDINPIT